MCHCVHPQRHNHTDPKPCHWVPHTRHTHVGTHTEAPAYAAHMHTQHMLRKSRIPAPHCYTAATFREASQTVGREHTLTWYIYCTYFWYILLLDTLRDQVSYCVYLCLCVSHSSTPTSLCRHGFLLSSNTMLFLFFAPLSLLSVSPPLSLGVSGPLSSTLSLSLVTQLSAQSNVSQRLLSHTLALLGEAELPSSLLLSPLPSFPGAFSFSFCLPLSLPLWLSPHLYHSLCSSHSFTQSSWLFLLSASPTYNLSLCLYSPALFHWCLIIFLLPLFLFVIVSIL